MKTSFLALTTLTLLSTATFAKTESKVSTKEASQIFKAVGFSKTTDGWDGGCGLGEITTYKDLNGDGLKEAVISDSSFMCYGNTGVGYYIISKQLNGTWKPIFENMGIPTFLKTKGIDG